jgi:hypothetical protein
MMNYRCYFLGVDGHIRDYIAITAHSDREAIEHAQKSWVQSVHDGFDLWQLGRFVHGVSTR